MKILQWKKHFLLIILIFTALLYFFSLFAPPFWDDYNFIFNFDGILKSTSPFVFWDSHSDFAKAWPLTYSLFWIFFRLFGAKYYLYKLVNISIHLLNVILAHKLITKLKFPWPLFSTLLFAIHPLHVEAVSWIFQLSTLLSLTFFLLSYIQFLHFLEGRKKSSLALCFVYFSLSLYCKPMASVLVFIFALHFSWKKVIQNRKKKELIIAAVSILIVLAASLCATITGLREGRSQEIQLSRHYALLPLVDGDQRIKNLLTKELKDPLAHGIVSKISLMLQTNSFYIGQYFLPIQQMFIYPKFQLNWGKNIWRLVFLISLLILLFYFWESPIITHKSIVWGILFYFFAIFPVSGITYVTFMKYSYVSDHWAYFAVLGLSVFTTGICHQLSLKLKPIWVITLLSLFSLSLFIRCFYYSKIFNHPVQNYTHTIKYNPETPMPYLLLGTNLYNSGLINEAEQIMLEAYYKWPHNFEILRILHQVYLKEGRQKESMDSLAEMAYQYFQSGDVQLARVLAQEVIISRPDNVFAREILKSK